MTAPTTIPAAGAAAARTLREAVAGPVHLPGEEGYDQARLPWQRAIDPYPAVVLEATGPRDVQAAVRAARDHDLPLAVQATGHGAVRACDGALLLTTGRMTGVEVDPGRQVARVGAGATWGDVVAAAAPHGLAPLSGSALSVGVVGYTLGGGAGWLSRTYGYAADSLLRSQLVTAGGELLTVSAGEHPDLFWALRGGGGNFGVVTTPEIRLYPVERVTVGMVMFDADRAAETLACYREWAPTEPDASNTALMLLRVPPAPQLPEKLRGRQVLALRVFYLGGPGEAERALTPLWAAAGPALSGGLQAVRYADATTALTGPPPGPTAAVSRLDLLNDIPDEVTSAAMEADEQVAAVEVRHWGGAMARPAPDAGPVGHREVPFSVMVAAPAEDRAHLAAARAAVEQTAARIRPHTTGGSFLNFLTDPARTPSAYTPADYQRLTEVKAAYDPGNLFRGGHNIPPAG